MSLTGHFPRFGLVSTPPGVGILVASLEAISGLADPGLPTSNNKRDPQGLVSNGGFLLPQSTTRLWDVRVIRTGESQKALYTESYKRPGSSAVTGRCRSPSVKKQICDGVLDFVWKAATDRVKVFFICLLLPTEDPASPSTAMLVLILFDGIVEHVGKDGLFGCLSNC